LGNPNDEKLVSLATDLFLELDLNPQMKERSGNEAISFLEDEIGRDGVEAKREVA
jgi:hypothetical protein